MTGGLSTRRIVDLWEHGTARQPLDQATLILWAAGFEGDANDLPVAERDRHLLELRASTFGAAVSTLADCPACAATVEIELDAHELAAAITERPAEEIDLGRRKIRVRPLTSRDLAVACRAMESTGDVAVEDVTRLLCERLGDVDDLDPAELELLARVIDERESAGELELALRCEECGESWSEPFDPEAHLWQEIRAAAHRSLSQVAELAQALGWSEAEILAMSDRRRSAYLSLIATQS